MHYEINISLHGKHFFATAERSITDSKKLREVYTELKARFPASEGFDLKVSRWERSGQHIDPATIFEPEHPHPL